MPMVRSRDCSRLIITTVFPSEMAQIMFPKGIDDPTEDDAMPSYTPMKRAGRVQEMEATILYMAGQGGAFLNGSIQVIDGGRVGLIPGATY